MSRSRIIIAISAAILLAASPVLGFGINKLGNGGGFNSLGNQGGKVPSIAPPPPPTGCSGPGQINFSDPCQTSIFPALF